MKFSNALDELVGKTNSLVYGRPGSGKTTFGLQHPGRVIVDPKEMGYMTILEEFQRDVPVITPATLDDYEDIIYEPERVIANLKQSLPKWQDYDVQSFIFENLNMVQEDLLGRPSRVSEKKQVLRKATGIMALPNSRDNRFTPGPKDYNVLSRNTKDLIRGIRAMPYNTLITVHAGIYDSEESPKGIATPDDQKIKEGFPNLYGQLKWVGGGLADFYFYMERKNIGNKLQYWAYPAPKGKYEGRSKIVKQLDLQINWTDKNLFNYLQGKLATGIERVREKEIKRAEAQEEKTT
jgi:hypothetical protein